MTVTLTMEGLLIAKSIEKREVHHPWRLVGVTRVDIFQRKTEKMVTETTVMRRLVSLQVAGVDVRVSQPWVKLGRKHYIRYEEDQEAYMC